MGKFRAHTLEEKRKLRNAREKRKRKQRAAKKQGIVAEQITKGIRNKYEEQKILTEKQREAARKFYRRWRENSTENRRLKELLAKKQEKVKAKIT